MSILSKTDKKIKVQDVSNGEHEDIVVITVDGSGRKYKWTVQTVDGVYNYSAGCLLFVNNQEFNYRWQGADFEDVYQHHLDVVIESVREFQYQQSMQR